RVDDRGGVEEVAPIEAHRAGAVDGRHPHAVEARAQRGDRRAQVGFRLDVAAQAQAGGAHAGASAPAAGRASLRRTSSGASLEDWNTRKPNSGSTASRWSKMSPAKFS